MKFYIVFIKVFMLSDHICAKLITSQVSAQTHQSMSGARFRFVR